MEQEQIVNQWLTTHIVPKIVSFINERDSLIPLQPSELIKLLSTYALPVNELVKSLGLVKNTEKKCIYIAPKGRKSGKMCEKPTLDGSDYCNTCLKKINSPKMKNDKAAAVPRVMTEFLEDQGIWVDKETTFVFKKQDDSLPDEQTIAMVIGKRCADGKISALTKDDITYAMNEGYTLSEEYTN